MSMPRDLSKFDTGYDPELEALQNELHYGNVPVSVAAKVYGKDPQWIRAGLISGYLPIGTATRNGKQVTDIDQQGHGGRINYYISPKLLYEQTGYLWEGGKG